MSKKIKRNYTGKRTSRAVYRFSFSADTSFEYDNNKDWELTCNYAKLEYLGTDITKTDEGLEFYAEGYAKPTEVFFS